MSGELLTVCIPTYNRAAYLRENLESLIPQARDSGVAICVSDNGSTDETEQVVRACQAVYPRLEYHRNQRNMGPDYNVNQVLKMARSEYAWLLGDDDRIVPGALARIRAALGSAEHDVIVVNGGSKRGDRVIGRVRRPAGSKRYQDQNILLRELGWHMTWMSCLIFNRRLIAGADFAKHYGAEILQFSVIFDWLAGKRFTVLWLSTPFVYAAERGLPSWFSQACDTFAKRWYEVVMALPASYDRAAKLACIKSHGVNSRCFSLQWLFSYRLFGYFDRQQYRLYREYFPAVTNVPLWLIWLIARLPVPRSVTNWLRRDAARLKEHYDRHREKINYLLVGGWNTVFGYLTFLALYLLLAHRIHYLFLLVISNILSITNAYLGYKIFVFKTRGNHLREYLRFYVVYGGALALNFILLPLCVELLKLSPPVAQGGLMFINVIFSYLGHKNFSFKVK